MLALQNDPESLHKFLCKPYVSFGYPFKENGIDTEPCKGSFKKPDSIDVGPYKGSLKKR